MGKKIDAWINDREIEIRSKRKNPRFIFAFWEVLLLWAFYAVIIFLIISNYFF